MSPWHKSIRNFEFGGLSVSSVVRTDGKISQVQRVKSINMNNGTLASHQEVIDEAIDSMEDVSLQFRPATDYSNAEIRITGWISMEEYENSFIALQ